jgi:hypothetical protein
MAIYLSHKQTDVFLARYCLKRWNTIRQAWAAAAKFAYPQK